MQYPKEKIPFFHMEFCGFLTFFSASFQLLFYDCDLLFANEKRRDLQSPAPHIWRIITLLPTLSDTHIRPSRRSLSSNQNDD